MNLFNVFGAAGAQEGFCAQNFKKNDRKFPVSWRILGLVLAFGWCALGVQAQTFEYEQTLVPEFPQTGDTADLELAVTPSSSAYGFSTVLHFDPLGYDVSNVTGTVDSSWLGEPSEINLTVTSAGDSVTISATRTDQVEQTGSGHVVTLGGIFIVDDLHTKMPDITAVWFETLMHTHPAITAGPNPMRNHLRVQTHGQALTKLELRDIEGRQIPVALTADQYLDNLGQGIYFLHVETADGNMANIKLVR